MSNKNVLIVISDDMMDVTAMPSLQNEIPKLNDFKNGAIHYTNMYVSVSHCGRT